MATPVTLLRVSDGKGIKRTKITACMLARFLCYVASGPGLCRDRCHRRWNLVTCLVWWVLTGWKYPELDFWLFLDMLSSTLRAYVDFQVLSCHSRITSSEEETRPKELFYTLRKKNDWKGKTQIEWPFFFTSFGRFNHTLGMIFIWSKSIACRKIRMFSPIWTRIHFLRVQCISTFLLVY